MWQETLHQLQVPSSLQVPWPLHVSTGRHWQLEPPIPAWHWHWPVLRLQEPFGKLQLISEVQLEQMLVQLGPHRPFAHLLQVAPVQAGLHVHVPSWLQVPWPLHVLAPHSQRGPSTPWLQLQRCVVRLQVPCPRALEHSLLA